MFKRRFKRVKFRCSASGCQKEATLLPKLLVPLRDSGEHTPLGVLARWPLCRKHFAEEIDVQTLVRWYSPTREWEARGWLAEQQLTPDFTRAYVQKVPINSAECEDFHAY